MGYQTSVHKEKEEKQKIHPVWRAIGCVMIVIIPVIAFTGALLFLEYNGENHLITWPSEFAAPGNDAFLYIKIGLTFAFSLILYIIFMVFTFVANAALGPSRYGPQDVPQARYRGKDYKR
ncbi:MAG: hypothetical protein HPY85_04500 [Anaerolineae bacterium]|nr:hypothetical protein [Anaerolineae bacterium]